MIEVNILKARWEKYKRRILILRIFVFYFAGLLLIVLICSTIFFSNKLIIERIKKEIKDFENKAKTERVLFENLKESNEKLQILCEKCSFYEDEYKNRVTWSRNLAIISESLPDGMWLIKLSYKKEFTEEGKEIIILLEGFISPFYIKPEKGCLIFARNLKEKGNNIFEKVSLIEITKGQKEDNEVYYFKFEIKAKK
ncbi:MAG: PilN domain-containing protein [Candidatus Omnitrophica bacterium]|nr:PilN domain-containing protein [Candidatus Omnitrophota bacterium]